MPTIVPILLYHSISPDAAPRFRPWAVNPEGFAAQLAYLREAGWTPLTVTQFIAARRAGPAWLPERPVIITVDDGFADFYTHAWPALQRHGFSATLYLVTGCVGQTSRWLRREGEGGRPMLSWDQVAELAAGGVEIGAHTRAHSQLDTLSEAEAWNEIRGSKDDLEQRLGRPVMSFAYPHGYHSPALKQQVQRAGFTSACAVKHALSAPGDDAFALARLFIFADTGVEGLSRLLAGGGLRVAPQRESVKTWGWRLARRSVRRLRRSLAHAAATDR